LKSSIGLFGEAEFPQQLLDLITQISETATAAPCRANVSAMVRPQPDPLPPITSTTFWEMPKGVPPLQDICAYSRERDNDVDKT
jgi:hypothetical protein